MKIKYLLIILLILIGLTAIWLIFYSYNSGVLTLDEKVQQYCQQEDVSGVYVSKNYIKVVHSMSGEGITYYPMENNGGFSCPGIAVDQMSDQCRKMSTNNNWLVICEK